MIAAAASTPLLHILHTNDFHNSLDDGAASRLERAIADLNGAPHLLLDAGDAIKAGNVGVNPFGEPILDRMNALGYDAMTMGNREFHVLEAALATKIGRARFPILCANIRSKGKTTSPLPVVPYVAVNRCGIRIAVFGVTVPMVTAKMKVAAALSDYLFDDPIETARSLVAQLREGADLLIALTHIGLREDERLARSVPGIDLIIGGHSHVSLAEPELVSNDSGHPTLLLQAGWHARSYGHATLRRTPDGAWRVEAALHPLKEPRR